MNSINETFRLHNNINIPKIAFGTAPLKGDEVYQAVLSALKAGYRHIDTAKIYDNEEMVGKAIKDSNIERDEIFITSKLDPNIKDYDAALDAFEETVERLGVSYLDLYLIHAPRPFDKQDARHNIGNVKVWQALETLYKENSVRAIGVSNFNIDDLKNIIWHAEERPHVNQIKLHIGLNQEEIIQFCKSENILVEAYSPLAKGTYLNHEIIQSIANKYNVTTAQLSLKYLLQNDILPIPRSKNISHITQNTKLDFTIDAEDMHTLKTLELAK